METRTRERTSKTSKKNKKKSSGKIVRILLIVLAALLVVLGTLPWFSKASRAGSISATPLLTPGSGPSCARLFPVTNSATAFLPP